MMASVTRLSTNKSFWLYFTTVVVFALFLRSWAIEIRPLHHDEAVNWYFIGQTNQLGYYPYSHENYHGPTYFYLLKLVTDISGQAVSAMRIPSIVFGSLMALLLVAFRKRCGDDFVLFSALLMAVSPSLVFYSRYSIHEILFVFLTLWLATSLFYWLEDRSKLQLASSSIAFGLLVATKETFVISCFSLVLASLAAFRWARIWDVIKSQKLGLLVAGVASLVIASAFFTGGFRWFDGLSEASKALNQWFNRSSSDVGHHKPVYYYLKVVFETEPYLLLVFIAPLFAAFNRLTSLKELCLSHQYRHARFFIVWFLSSFIIYSLIPYKTPWLMINFIVPGCISLGWLFAGEVWIKRWKSHLTSLLVIVSFVFAGTSACKYIAKVPYGKKNPYSYVHTQQGTLRLVDDLQRYWLRNPESKALIGVQEYWPLPYYVRGFEAAADYQNVQQLDNKVHGHYDILILSPKVHVPGQGWIIKNYQLTDNQKARVYFRAKS